MQWSSTSGLIRGRKEREILNLPNLPQADFSSLRLSVGNPKPLKVQACSLFVVPGSLGTVPGFALFTQYLILDIKNHSREFNKSLGAFLFRFHKAKLYNKLFKVKTWNLANTLKGQKLSIKILHKNLAWIMFNFVDTTVCLKEKSKFLYPSFLLCTPV